MTSVISIKITFALNAHFTFNKINSSLTVFYFNYSSFIIPGFQNFHSANKKSHIDFSVLPNGFLDFFTVIPFICNHDVLHDISTENPVRL